MTALQFNRASGQVTPARFIPSPNCDQRPAEIAIEVLIIHAISLPPRQYGGEYIQQFFTNRLDFNAHPYFANLRDMKVSAHFVIMRDGELLQFVATHQRAWHAGKSNFQGRAAVNDFSIGIELEGCDEAPFEPAQYDTLSNLIRVLTNAYPRIRQEHIVGHSDIAADRKTDPGPCFDWSQIRDALPVPNLPTNLLAVKK